MKTSHLTKKIYRSIIVLEVLSEEPIKNESLEDIVSETIDGAWSGNYDFTTLNEEVFGKDAVKLCENHGTDPEFLFMDIDGNKLDKEDGEDEN